MVTLLGCREPKQPQPYRVPPSWYPFVPRIEQGIRICHTAQVKQICVCFLTNCYFLPSCNRARICKVCQMSVWKKDFWHDCFYITYKAATVLCLEKLASNVFWCRLTILHVKPDSRQKLIACMSFRISPSEWTEPDNDHHGFTLSHSFWYLMGALTLQGNAAKTFPGWWRWWL